MDETQVKKAEAIMESIVIPSQPQILLNIHKEILKPEPDFRKIKEFVSQDIAIAAKIIKIANSAIFGLKYKVHSIENALTVLGMENFTNIVVTSSLRDSLMGSHLPANESEDFFNHSMHVARISQFITHKVRIFSGGLIFPSQTYMAGLFHDCGIIILAKKYPDYFEKVKSSISEGQLLINAEEKNYKTNHCIVGYVVSKSWLIPDIVCKIIQHHHDTNFDIHTDVTLKKMLSINILAESITAKISEAENIREKIYGLKIDSKEVKKHLLDELNFDEDDYKDIVETSANIIHQE